MRFSVRYTKQVEYEATVEVSDLDIEEGLREEISADDTTFDGSTISATVEVEIEDIIVHRVESGDVEDETEISVSDDVESIYVESRLDG